MNSPTTAPAPVEIRVIACEDDADLREILLRGLGYFGITVATVADGISLDKALQESLFDIALLDIGLPGENGLSIASRLRRTFPTLGIVILTARGDTGDRIRGFEGGADLYMTKPVDLRELASALKSLYRRLHPVVPISWELTDNDVRLITPKGVRIELTERESVVLKKMLTHAGQTVSREVLYRLLDLPDDANSARRLETMVSRLRAKVRETSGGEMIPLRARHGSGYVLLTGDDDIDTTTS